MGKGDRKTRRGKIWRGTFGRLRPSDSTKTNKPDVASKPEPKS